jgi:hypothetical protein
VQARKQDTITYEQPRSLQGEAVREVVVVSERPTASLPARCRSVANHHPPPSRVPGRFAATPSPRARACSPGAAGAAHRNDHGLDARTSSSVLGDFFRRLMAEIRSVWREIAVELGLRTESDACADGVPGGG